MDITLNHADYNKIRRFSDRLAGSEVTYFSKLGTPNWDQVTPASKLLAEYVNLDRTDRTLLINGGHAALAVVLARQLNQTELWVSEPDHIALKMAEKTLEQNAVQDVKLLPETELSPESIRSSFDVVVMQLPKGRKYARRQLMTAYTALRPGGRFYLAGAKRSGILSVIQDAEALFGNTNLLGFKKGNRIGMSIKDQSYKHSPEWSREPGISPGSWFELLAIIGGEAVPLVSLPGVFSYDRLDKGTHLLLSHMQLDPGMRTLDIGCGYGVIGLVAAHTAIHVDMVDASFLAVASARANLERHKLLNASVYPSDVTESVKGTIYDRVFTNPPFHSGADVDYAMAGAFISQAYASLAAGGELWLVANRFIRYDRLMGSVFEHIETVSATDQFHLLKATRT
jgi:16S rRNA (guanine1207-N2)-methyltransferase